MKLYNKKVYECEHCGKISKSAGGMAIHEKTCRKNPNVRPMCWGCCHFDDFYGDNDKEHITFITFDAWAGEYPHKADMKPSKCMVDGCKLYNRIGVHCEELEIALQDEGWRLCPTVGTIPNEELENQIAENIFDWWLSGVSYAQWYSNKFLQQRIDFDNEEGD